MGVYWAKEAAKQFNGRVEVIDLRTLIPLDEELVFERVKAHGKCIVLTEEQLNNSFAEAFAHRISKNCFQISGCSGRNNGISGCTCGSYQPGTGKRNASEC
jgi:pyruvate/2-oxoglutarate/acetoin dehydrogenase E1 component